jgi:nucleotide-binding universal stress UspA family protein
MQECQQQLFTMDMLASPKRILVATDIDDLEGLLPHAIAQARASGALVTIVHSIYPLYVASLETAVIPVDYEATLINDVRARISGAVNRMIAAGVDSCVFIKIGRASDVILQELIRTNSSRLIMGTHGRGKLRQFALGSVAHDLVTKVSIPIFVIGPHARHSGMHAKPSKILHPVSFVGNYPDNCLLALQIAKNFGAEITFLHILEQSIDHNLNPARSIAWAENALADCLPRDLLQSHSITMKVVFGDVAKEILVTAKDMRADWIVLSTDEGSQNGVFTESRAFAVLANANCPILTLGR